MPDAELSAPDVGARILSRRNEMGMSLDELAARFRSAAGTRTTPGTIARWQRSGNLTVGEVRVLAGILDVSARWLLLGDE